MPQPVFDCHHSHRRRAWAGVWVLLALVLLVAAVRAATEPYSLRPQGSGFDVQSLLTLAEQGDKRAAFLLGTRYATGRDTARDDSEALRWFTQAARAGLAEAQFNLGVMYAQGRGVPRDIKLAVQWYTRAAQQGLARAQYNLGTLYSTGGGVPRDEAKAADWLERAARKGIAPAQYNLAILYEFGRGVRMNAAQALHWYRQAEDYGYAPARARRQRLERLLATPAGVQQESAAAAPTPGADADPRIRTAAAPEAPSESAEPPANPVTAATPEPASVSASATTASGQTPLQPAPAAGVAEDWLTGLNGEHYTLQLASYVDREAAEQFMHKLDAGGASGIYASTKQGKRWYSVIYGDYASYQQAKSASRSLPKVLRGIKPWVRKIALIQKEQDQSP